MAQPSFLQPGPRPCRAGAVHGHALTLDRLVKVTSDPVEAGFLLAHGTEALGRPGGPAVDATLDEMRDVLRRCAERRLPMIVANPDLVGHLDNQRLCERPYRGIYTNTQNI